VLILTSLNFPINVGGKLAWKQLVRARGEGNMNCLVKVSITWFQDHESPLNLHEDFQSIQYILVRGQKYNKNKITNHITFLKENLKWPTLMSYKKVSMD
jgi:hypothetical protein